MLPPTSQLSPIKSITTTATDRLQSSIDYLWMIYNPPVRGSLRRNKHNYRSSSAPDLQLLRTDAFERDYSLRWLTALVSQLGAATVEPCQRGEVALMHEKLINSAASLLAICAGTASAGTISRTFVFETADALLCDHTNDRSSRIFTVELKDVPLDNHDYRSVGAQTWGSACIMADMIAENPPSFGIPPLSERDSCWSHRTFRCLELGAGTGLVSLTVAKILELQLSALKNDLADKASLEIEVVPTDYYPAVLGNLERNIRTNFTQGSPLHIHSHPLDWSVFPESQAASDPAALQKSFNVIYGADIIYEAQHAEWIKGCLLKLLRTPDNVNEDPAFHLIIPLRGTHKAESNTIEQVFEARKDRVNKGGDCDLVIKHKEIIICESETGSIEEVEYVYYRIGWEI